MSPFSKTSSRIIPPIAVPSWPFPLTHSVDAVVHHVCADDVRELPLQDGADLVAVEGDGLARTLGEEEAVALLQVLQREGRKEEGREVRPEGVLILRVKRVKEN